MEKNISYCFHIQTVTMLPVPEMARMILRVIFRWRNVGNMRAINYANDIWHVESIQKTQFLFLDLLLRSWKPDVFRPHMGLHEYSYFINTS